MDNLFNDIKKEPVLLLVPYLFLIISLLFILEGKGNMFIISMKY